MDEVQITSIIRKVSQGATEPYLCEADDNSQYVVKGKTASRKELIYEWIVANLAIKFGLPVPPVKKAFADEAFTQYDLYYLYNVNFASQFQANIQDIRFDQLENVPQAVLKDLFFFDYWIQNGDRCLTATGGNPNFFLHQKTSEPFVLDHNLAFDDAFSLQDHKKIHISAQFWHGLDLVDRQDYEKRITACLGKLADTFNSLPEDWQEVDEQGRIRTHIEGILNKS